MDNLYIDAEIDSPRITLDYTNGLIEMEGKSYPSDSFTFYAPVIKWLESYFDGNAKESTTINIKLVYFNSASIQVLFDIFDIVNSGKYNDLVINWFYDRDTYENYEDMNEEFKELRINAIKY